MLIAMSSWLESVMIAFAPCFLTRSKRGGAGLVGRVPELPSTISKRTLPWPAS